MALHKWTPLLMYIFVTLTKKHPIQAEFRVNNASSIGNQNTKFQINQLE